MGSIPDWPRRASREIRGVTAWILLAAGIAGAVLGGDLFVRGSAGISRRAGIPTAFLGATLGALATSFPEMSVALVSSLEGRPEISVGDVLGSNVANISLVLATALCFAPVRAPRHAVRSDYPVALLVPVLLFAFSFDGVLSRIDGLWLAGAFVLWAGWSVFHAGRNRKFNNGKTPPPDHAASFGVAGVVLLALSGWLIVEGSTRISRSLGISEFSVGAMLVAFGTSTPEMATLLISGFRRQGALGLGTILGSNIVNGLLVAGVAAAITPAETNLSSMAILCAGGLATTALVLPGRGGWIGKKRGPLLLLCYGAINALLAFTGDRESSRPREADETALAAEPQEPVVAAHFLPGTEFVDADSPLALRSRHPHPPGTVAAEIHHHMGDRRLSLRAVGVFPEKQIARPQGAREPGGVRRGAAEFSPLPEEFELGRAGARQHLAAVFAVEPADRIRAVHRPGLEFAGRQPGPGVADALRLEPACQRLEAGAGFPFGECKRDSEQEKTGQGGKQSHGTARITRTSHRVKSRAP